MPRCFTGPKTPNFRCQGKKAKEVVDLADDDNASRAAAIRRARRRAKAKGKHPGIRPAPKVATVANGDEVEVLESPGVC
jgi:hypothetical protein